MIPVRLTREQTHPFGVNPDLLPSMYDLPSENPEEP
jgi:hypothetical protein